MATMRAVSGGRHRAPAASPGQRRSPDGAGQFGDRFMQEITHAQLRTGNHRHRTGGQCFGRDIAGTADPRTAHDDRRGPAGHDLAQEGNAIHARHLDVEQDHVRPLLLHLAQGKHRIGRGPDDADVGSLRQQLLYQLAHHRGVIDHHHADG